MGRIYGKRLRITAVPNSGRARVWECGGERSLRAEFECAKTGSSEGNGGWIQLYNLADDSRGFCAESARHLIVEAGYGQTLELLFRGDVTHVASRREGGTEWITRIESEDARAASRAQLDVSFAPGASVDQVVSKILDVVRDKDAAKGFLVDLKAKGADLVHGFSASGSVNDVLGELLAPRGLEHSFQDNAIQIVDAASPSTNDPIVRLSRDSGLVGSPEWMQDDGASTRKRSGVKAIAKLQPRIRPGRVVAIESRTVSGVFVVRAVVHRGDTHADRWDTEFEAK